MTASSLERELYGLIIGRLDGAKICDRAYRDKMCELAGKGLCGFLIFGGERSEIRSFVAEVGAVAGMPLFMASDVERGIGQQIRGSTNFPCQMAVAAAVDRNRPKDIVMLRDMVRAVAEEALDTGLNMPLIPVLDVNREPDNPIICTRAFSDDPRSVAWFGSEYVSILENAGLISCAKHFPGHGDTTADSHMTLPVIRKSFRDIEEIDILPFREAIRSGVSSIMIGHLSIPAIDARPASLSRKIMTELLRGELGFQGLIMTDALIMDALNDFGNVSAECLRAGADILLHPADPDITVTELAAAVKCGDVPVRTVEAAAERIKRTKARLGKAIQREIDYDGHERLSRLMSEKSVSLIKNTPGIIPLRDQPGINVTFFGDEEAYRSGPFMTHFAKGSAMCRQAKRDTNGVHVFAIFTNVSAWRGSSGISESERNSIRSRIRRDGRSIVVSFGSPYVLRHFGEADVLIGAYETTDQAQKAVVDCLEGRRDFGGIVPVRIDL